MMSFVGLVRQVDVQPQRDDCQAILVGADGDEFIGHTADNTVQSALIAAIVLAAEVAVSFTSNATGGNRIAAVVVAYPTISSGNGSIDYSVGGKTEVETSVAVTYSPGIRAVFSRS